MLKNIAMFIILGKPLFLVFGILAFITFLATASIPIINQKSWAKIPFPWHPRLAKITLVLAVIHAILAFTAFAK